jgi:hypothetical protein
MFFGDAHVVAQRDELLTYLAQFALDLGVRTR